MPALKTELEREVSHSLDLKQRLYLVIKVRLPPLYGGEGLANTLKLLLCTALAHVNHSTRLPDCHLYTRVHLLVLLSWVLGLKSKPAADEDSLYFEEPWLAASPAAPSTCCES